MVGLTNDERYLIYNLRVEKHWDFERIMNMFSYTWTYFNCKQLIANAKIVQAVQISDVLQFIWHYTDVVENGATFFGRPGMVWTTLKWRTCAWDEVSVAAVVPLCAGAHVMPVAALVARPVVNSLALRVPVETLLRTRLLWHYAQQHAAITVWIHQLLHETRCITRHSKIIKPCSRLNTVRG